MIPLRDELKSRTFPVGTIFIITLNAIVFFYQQLHFNYEFLRDNLALIPVKVIFMHDKRFYFTLITYIFLHAGWRHFLSNMLYLWVFGKKVEDITGHLGFIYFYLLCGIGAGFIHTVINPASSVPTIGASGAISGILAAYMVLYPSARIVMLIPLFILVVKIPAYLFIGLWFILQFFYGISSLSAESTVAGVAWFAHIGGFVVGILLLPVFLIINRFLNR